MSASAPGPDPSHQRIAHRIRELLAYHSGAPVASLSERSTPQNTPGWDSVANLLFMEAIEDEFGVTVTTRDAMKLRSLADIEAYLHAAEAAAATAQASAQPRSSDGSR